MTQAFQNFPLLDSLKDFVSVFPLLIFLFSFGSSLSNTDLIFLANINSAGDNRELVLDFAVPWYILKNCRVSLTDSFQSTFFHPHLKVYTNLSICLLDRRWYGQGVMCIIEKDLQKSLKSFAVNCVLSSDIIVSGIPNLLKSSCKNLIVSLHVGCFFYIFSPLAILSSCQLLLDNIVPSVDLQHLCASLTKVCPSFDHEVNFIVGALAAIAQSL